MKRAKTTFMKRGISILLSLTMLALLLPARSVLAETVEDSAAQKGGILSSNYHTRRTGMHMDK